MSDFFLDFEGLRYRLSVPAILKERIEADYGAFLCDGFDAADYVVSVTEEHDLPPGGNTKIGDWFQIGPRELSFRCKRLDRSGWERSVRTYLTAHVSSQLYARKGLVRLHAGLVRYRSKNILVSGPSGAGKTSLCLALGTAPSGVCYAHEMVFANTSMFAMGWPQPFTVNEGTLRWFMSARAELIGRVEIENSVQEGVKNRIKVPFLADGVTLDGIDLILFPTRITGRGADVLRVMDRQTVCRRLSTEVEVPGTFNYAPLDPVDAFMASTAQIAQVLAARCPAYGVEWFDDQRIVVSLIDGLIDSGLRDSSN
jgi:hypothetical protein